ncbi:MAG: hypothetical protein F2817_20090, partial [Actinobacteria bacterium]|nr:hypothetical protein [Actinomycetota bacterium]
MQQRPPSAPGAGGAAGPPPFAAGLSRGRVWIAARPVHGPADVARVLRALGRLRGVHEVALLQQRGDVADFVVDLGRPIAMAADLKSTMGAELRSCVRTADGFVLELEPSPGAPAAPPGPTGAPL